MRAKPPFESGPNPGFRGFTLIELLIVVAIIAILAAIAVPNFLEVQVRAKASRVVADLRTISIGLEAYAVDNRDYPPNDGIYNVVPIQLSTPISYVTNGYLTDPFANNVPLPDDYLPDDPQYIRYYTYDKILTMAEFFVYVRDMRPLSGSLEFVDDLGANVGAFWKYGKWRTLSLGPDREYRLPDYEFGSDPCDPNGVLLGSDILYDPTNGTLSPGNILFTQKHGWKQTMDDCGH
jgi:type II secretion system protein G